MRKDCGCLKPLGLGWLSSESGPYLQLELDLIANLGAGQAQLPTMDPQEHSMGFDRHHVYLLWGRAEGKFRL